MIKQKLDSLSNSAKNSGFEELYVNLSDHVTDVHPTVVSQIMWLIKKSYSFIDWQNKQNMFFVFVV